jgi:NAD(P)-dependent dehydrogenase (short-subunit alcohol dehydrogenase family)
VTKQKIWFITGAGRGMGADFAKAALAAGHAVAATGRNRDAVSKALGTSNDLLAVTRDVTSRADAEAAVRAAVDRFGRIDVLQNGRQTGDPAKLARALITHCDHRSEDRGSQGSDRRESGPLDVAGV